MIAVGVIGMGFVGNAVAHGLWVKSRLTGFEIDIKTYDKFRPEKSDSSLSDIERTVDICFVCVPTPMNSDGSCDISIIHSVLDELSSLSRDYKRQVKLIVVIKSTIPPGTCAKLQNEFENIDIVFNPEFLTEANAEVDFYKQDRIVLGGSNRDAVCFVEEFYSGLFDCLIMKTSWETAEMVKYTANCFLATKVSFANEIKQITDSLNLDYNEVIKLATLDARLGDSHWQVPGPMLTSDGTNRYLPGFSGSCFVKDINALIYLAKSRGVTPTILQAAWQKNIDVRPEKDWEALVGRAISNNGESNE